MKFDLNFHNRLKIILTILLYMTVIQSFGLTAEKLNYGQWVEENMGKEIVNVELIQGMPPHDLIALHDVNNNKHPIYVLAIIDRNLVDGHVQQAAFEQFSTNHATSNLGFGIVYLTRRPESYLKYLVPTRPSPCRQYGVTREIFAREYFDPQNRSLILFIDDDNRIMKCLESYCSYDMLQEVLRKLMIPSVSSGGPQS